MKKKQKKTHKPNSRHAATAAGLPIIPGTETAINTAEVKS